jgi:predicted membrane protein
VVRFEAGALSAPCFDAVLPLSADFLRMATGPKPKKPWMRSINVGGLRAGLLRRWERPPLRDALLEPLRRRLPDRLRDRDDL